MELSSSARDLLKLYERDEQMRNMASNTNKALPELPQTPTRRATWMPLERSSESEISHSQFNIMDQIKNERESKERAEQEFQAELTAALDYREAQLGRLSLDPEDLELVLERHKHTKATIEQRQRQRQPLVSNQQLGKTPSRRLRSTSISSSPEDRRRTLTERYARDGELRPKKAELQENEIHNTKKSFRSRQQGVIDRYRIDKARNKEIGSIEEQSKPSLPFSPSSSTTHLDDPLFTFEAQHKPTLPSEQISKPAQPRDPSSGALPESCLSVIQNPKIAQLSDPPFTIEAQHKSTLPLSQNIKPAQISDSFSEAGLKANLPFAHNSESAQLGDPHLTFGASNNSTEIFSKNFKSSEIGDPFTEAGTKSSLPFTQKLKAAQLGDSRLAIETQDKSTLPISQNFQSTQVIDPFSKAGTKSSLPFPRRLKAAQLSDPSFTTQSQPAQHKSTLPVSQISESVQNSDPFFEAGPDLRLSFSPNPDTAQFGDPHYTVNARSKPTLLLSERHDPLQDSHPFIETEPTLSVPFSQNSETAQLDNLSSESGPYSSARFSQSSTTAQFGSTFSEPDSSPSGFFSSSSATAQLSDSYLSNHQRTASAAAIPSFLKDHRIGTPFITQPSVTNTMPTLRSLISMRNLRQNLNTTAPSENVHAPPHFPILPQDRPLNRSPIYYHDSPLQVTVGIQNFRNEEAIGVAGGVPNLGTALHSNGVPVDHCAGPTGAEDFDFRYAVKVYTETKGNVPYHEADRMAGKREWAEQQGAPWPEHSGIDDLLRRFKNGEITRGKPPALASGSEEKKGRWGALKTHLGFITKKKEKKGGEKKGEEKKGRLEISAPVGTATARARLEGYE
ncbi:hypothetical protein MMC14_003059 [Varicellaria rhodocarpa]|nr:hypothetical protein [Varicellaria rhodocarpa]